MCYIGWGIIFVASVVVLVVVFAAHKRL